MRNFLATAATLALALAVGSAEAGDVKSGLDLGAAPGAFNVNDVTGPKAGTSLCYRCMYGARPVVSIFARKVDDNLAKLVKEVDEQVAKNSDKQMKAFVVLLTDDPDAAEGKLKELAQKQGIKNVPLTTYDGAAGPPSYNIAQDAELTVLMWNKSKVEVNHAFGQGEFNASKIDAIVSDSTKILK